MVLAQKLRRPKALAMAALLLIFSFIPLFTNNNVDAAILSNRQIQISSSAASEDNVTYHVEFDFGTSGNIQGIVVEFCAESPIIEDQVCNAPAGFDLNGTGALAVSGQSPGGLGVANLSTFTTAATDNSDRTLMLTAASPVAMTAGNTAYFDITSVTNPSSVNTTFYARIYTYATNTGATGYTLADPGAYIDAGGVALSTAQVIDVTSKVQEQLDFCVYTSAINGNFNCSGVSYNGGVILGDTNGVLSTNGAYVNKETNYSVATNASSGVAIRMKGTTLMSGAFDITANGVGTQSGAASSPGTEQFGICTYRATASDPGLIPDTVYDGDNAGNTSTACSGTTNTAGTGSTGGDNSAYFAFDDNSTDGTTSLYGDVIATKSAGDFSAGTLAMLGNVAYTTEAGIYTTALTFIATGTY